jgi:hypothetical protein
MFAAVFVENVDGAINIHQFTHHLSADSAASANSLSGGNTAKSHNVIFLIPGGISGEESHPFSTYGSRIGRILNVESRVITMVFSNYNGTNFEM